MQGFMIALIAVCIFLRLLINCYNNLCRLSKMLILYFCTIICKKIVNANVDSIEIVCLA